MKIIIAILLSTFTSTAYAQKLNFIRVCNGGPDNNLYWSVNGDPCSILPKVLIYGTESSLVFPFEPIDSVSIPIKSYRHLSANVPSNKPWQYFLKYQKVCGNDTFIIYTDTLHTDTVRPEPTYLDSVSVDPLTNHIYLGWRGNRTPDFNTYYIYSFDRANPILTQTYRDTLLIDSGLDPRIKSLSYQITSSDSCDNARPYDLIPHKTILLQGTIDTCKNEATLNWNQYSGWLVKHYEVYRSINGSTFDLIETVISSPFVDGSLQAKSTYRYFVRAVKDDIIRVTSSSQMLTLGTSNIINPTKTEIIQVTNNDNHNLFINIKREPGAIYGELELYRMSANDGQSNRIYTFQPEESTYTDFSSNTEIYRYYTISETVCGLYQDTSQMSNNIVLSLISSTNNLLKFNNYFTWNKGVKHYILYRASGPNRSSANNFVAFKNLGTDTFTIDSFDESQTICYYIDAEENETGIKSKSNIVCKESSGTIFNPNAIVINGASRFTFLGVGIDLNKSSLTIYDRWGKEVIQINDLTGGWGGENLGGGFVDVGVYIFNAKIYQDGNMVTKNGNITVLK